MKVMGGEIELVKGALPKLGAGQFVYKRCAYAVMIACQIIGREWQQKQQQQKVPHVG